MNTDTRHGPFDEATQKEYNVCRDCPRPLNRGCDAPCRKAPYCPNGATGPTPRQRMETALRLLDAVVNDVADNPAIATQSAWAELREALAATAATLPDDEGLDGYGNPLDGSEIINCCFPECGCDGARLCMAKNGANSAACAMNIERGSHPARATPPASPR